MSVSLNLFIHSARIHHHKQEKTAGFIYWETNSWTECLDANKSKIIVSTVLHLSVPEHRSTSYQQAREGHHTIQTLLF